MFDLLSVLFRIGIAWAGRAGIATQAAPSLAATPCFRLRSTPHIRSQQTTPRDMIRVCNERHCSVVVTHVLEYAVLVAVWVR